MKRFTILLVAIVLVFSGLKAETAPSVSLAGEGTSENPYLIETLADLRFFSENIDVDFWNSYFSLENSLDASETKDWNEGQGFLPVGRSKNFKGDFDGNNHTIKNVYINTGENKAAFFASTYNEATIKNLRLSNIYVNGARETAGLVGSLNDSSVVSNCFVSGEVYGSARLGGLIGYVENSIIELCAASCFVSGEEGAGLVGETHKSTVENCYATSAVYGESCAGLVYEDRDSSSFSQCYSTGTTISNEGEEQSGFIGKSHNYSMFTNCYFDKETSNSSNKSLSPLYEGQVIAPLTSAEMQNTQLANLVSNAAVWQTNTNSRPTLVGGSVVLSNSNVIDSKINTYIKNRSSYAETGLRYRKMTDAEWSEVVDGAGSNDEVEVNMSALERFVAYLIVPYVETATGEIYYGDFQIYSKKYHGGHGIEGNPFILESEEDLDSLASTPSDWSKTFALGKDITVANNFKGIGTSSQPFTGALSGEGYTITFTSSSIGLFKYLADANIANLNFSGSIYSASESELGILAKSVERSVISNIKATGCSVRGSSSVGGLFGVVENVSKISYCSFTGSVNGEKNVGGLIGKTENDVVISQCFTNVTLGGSGNNIGGIVGRLYSNSAIYNSSANVQINEASWYVGGIVGYNDESTINNCSASGSINDGSNYVGGITGRNFKYAEVSDCQSTVTVNSGSKFVGGLIGEHRSASLSNSFFSKENNVGIISVGNNYDNNSLLLPEKQHTGLSNAEFELQGSFTGWDFTNIWEISSTVNSLNFKYPKLKWEVTDNHVIVNLNISNAGTVSAPLVYTSGESFSLDIELKTGYQFVGWYIGDTEISTSPSANYTATGSGNLEIQAKVEILSLFSVGDGTEENPYNVNSLQHLEYVSNVYSLWDKHYVLTQNIDASGSQSLNQNMGFAPIGNLAEPFTGSFNGAGFTITNLYINRPRENYVGLFGISYSTAIRNIKLSNPYVRGNRYVGSICGSSDKYDGAQPGISTCSVVLGKVVGEGNFIGGIIGMNEGTATQCNFAGEIKGSDFSGQSYYIGGIVGWSADLSVISYSYFKGYIDGKTGKDIGGISGNTVRATIDKCSATGAIYGEERVGGISGDCSYSSVIQYSSAHCTVYGDNRVGGISGTIQSSSIVGCISGSSVVAESGAALAGYVESNWTAGSSNVAANIRNSYATGKVSANNTGKLYVNRNSADNTFENYYVDKESCTKVSYLLATELETEDFKDAAKLVGIPFGTGLEEFTLNVNGRPNLNWETIHVSNSGIVKISDTEIKVRWGRVDNLSHPSSVTEYGICWKNVDDTTWTTYIPKGSNVAAGSGVDIAETTITIAADQEIHVAAYAKVGLDIYVGDITGNSKLEEKYSGGYGTSDEPFLIESEEDLILLANSPNDWGSYFEQVQNIELSSVLPNPIGSSELKPFSGTYDGNKFTIRGFVDAEADKPNKAFFGHISNAAIRRLSIVDAQLEQCDSTAILVGFSNDSDISNCSVKGTISGDKVSGLVYRDDHSVIQSCFVNVQCSGSNLAGMVYVSEDSRFNHCYSMSNAAIVAVGNYWNSRSYYDSDYFTGTSNAEVNVEEDNEIPFTGLSTAQFANSSNFLDWDFANVWRLGLLTSKDANRRPYFVWQVNEIELTFITDGNGTITGEQNQTLYQGEISEAVEAVPNAGYKFLQWETFGDDYLSDSTTFKHYSLLEDLTIRAIFIKKSFDFTHEVQQGNGTIEVDKSSALTGETVTYTISPDELYDVISIEFNNVDVLSELVEDGDAYTYSVSASEDGHLIVGFRQTGYPVSVKFTQESSPRVYPNPSSDDITLLIQEPSEIRIFNIQGKMVYVKHLDESGVLNTNSLLNGSYIIEIIAGKMREKISFIKQ